MLQWGTFSTCYNEAHVVLVTMRYMQFMLQCCICRVSTMKYMQIMLKWGICSLCYNEVCSVYYNEAHAVYVTMIYIEYESQWSPCICCICYNEVQAVCYNEVYALYVQWVQFMLRYMHLMYNKIQVHVVYVTIRYMQ